MIYAIGSPMKKRSKWGVGLSANSPPEHSKN